MLWTTEHWMYSSGKTAFSGHIAHLHKLYSCTYTISLRKTLPWWSWYIFMIIYAKIIRAFDKTSFLAHLRLRMQYSNNFLPIVDLFTFSKLCLWSHMAIYYPISSETSMAWVHKRLEKCLWSINQDGHYAYYNNNNNMVKTFSQTMDALIWLHIALQIWYLQNLLNLRS